MYLSINILLRGRIRNMFQEKQEYYLSELQSNLIALALIALQILILYWTVAITIDCRATCLIVICQSSKHFITESKIIAITQILNNMISC